MYLFCTQHPGILCPFCKCAFGLFCLEVLLLINKSGLWILGDVTLLPSSEPSALNDQMLELRDAIIPP